MKKLFLVFLGRYYPVITYLFLSCFTILWFKDKAFISAGDFSWPVRFDIFFNLTKHVWDWSAAPGANASRQVSSLFPYASYGYVLFKIGIGSAIFERLIFFISFFFSGYGFYLFALRYVRTKLGAFFAGLLYMTSVYASVIIWNPAYGLSFPFFCYTPLSLAFLVDFCRDKKIISKKLFLTLLVTFFSFLGASYSNPAYFALYLVLAFFFVFTNIPSRSLAFKKFFTFITIYILLNMYWIIPFASSIEGQYRNSTNQYARISSDRNVQLSDSASLKDAFREMGFWTFNAGDAGDYYYSFRAIFNNTFFSLLSYICVGLALFGLTKGEKKIRSFYLLFFIGLAASSGLLFQNPFNLPFKFIYSLPLIDRMFRTVFSKTGIFISLSFPIILLGTVEKYTHPNAKKYAFLLITILILIRSAPFISGDVVKPAGNYLPSYALDIPSDYYQMADYINGNLDKNYLLSLPLPMSYNYVYKWKTGGYIGGDFLRTMINKSVYYVNNNNPEVLEFAYTFNPSLLNRLGVEHILLHKDVPLYFADRFMTADFNKMYRSIVLSNDYELLKETENLALYKIKNPNTSQLISTADDPVYLTSANITGNIFSNLTPNQILVKNDQVIPEKKIIFPQFINHVYSSLEDWNDGWAWPDARVSPESWLYAFAKAKENISLAFTFDSQDRINEYIWLDTKRVVELNKYSLRTKTIADINKYLESNSEKILRIFSKLPQADSNGNDISYLPLFNKVLRYTKRSLDLSSNQSEDTRSILSDFYNNLLGASKSYCQGKCWYFNGAFDGDAFVTGVDPSITSVFSVTDGKLQKEEFLRANSFNITSGKDYILVKKENTLNLLILPSPTRPYFDGRTAYVYNFFSNMDRHRDNSAREVTFNYRNPVVIEKYVDKVNPKNLYTLVINYSKVTARIDLLILEQGGDLEYAYVNGKIGDLGKLENADNLKDVVAQENITEKKFKQVGQGGYTYTKDFVISPNATALRIVLLVYAEPGRTESVQIDSLSLKSVEKASPLVSNFKFSSSSEAFENIVYQKINDYSFSFNLKGDGEYLVLNAAYDEGWVLTKDGKTLPHLTVDGYKNGWLLPIDDKPVNYHLEYEPDRYTFVGIYISLVTLFVSTLFFLRSLWKER